MKPKDLDISTLTEAELADIYMSQGDPVELARKADLEALRTKTGLAIERRLEASRLEAKLRADHRAFQQSPAGQRRSALLDEQDERERTRARYQHPKLFPKTPR